VREFRGSYPEDAQPRGVVREVTLTAAPTVVSLLDGRPLAVWAYNGQVPGPVLRVRLGETLRVTLVNGLPQPTTIHWHGVRVPNAMDGTPGVTQPPVAPGETFVYEFTPKDAGTFWFHPHLRASEQVARGLFGCSWSRRQSRRPTLPGEQARHLARLQSGFVPDALVGERTKPRRERESVCVRYLFRLRVKSLRQLHADRHVLGGAGRWKAPRDGDSTLRHRALDSTRTPDDDSRFVEEAVRKRLEADRRDPR
jgi:hypothetical protein